MFTPASCSLPKTSPPDLHIVALGKKHLPKHPVGVAHFKLTKFDHSVTESFHYSTRLMVIKFDKVSFQSILSLFFCTLYAAVHKSINYPISSPQPCLSPTCSLQLSNPLIHGMYCRVLEENGLVYKMYDLEKDKPNTELVNLVPEGGFD